LITSVGLEALMYDLPLLVASTRGRRRESLHTAARNAEIAVSTLYRIESGLYCDVRTLIRVLRWLEAK
jgi:hypothetical protein